jgi:hypothetical protein
MFVYTSIYPSVFKLNGQEFVYSRLPRENIIFREHEDYAKTHLSDLIKEVPGDAPTLIKTFEQKDSTTEPRRLTVIK